MEQYVNLVFTFHNVSINSLSPSLHRRIPSPFTFHNVSINSFPETNIGKLHKNHLHSIMYLLIPQKAVGYAGSISYLHSIMYLLILKLCLHQKDPYPIYIP